MPPATELGTSAGLEWCTQRLFSWSRAVICSIVSVMPVSPIQGVPVLVAGCKDASARNESNSKQTAPIRANAWRVRPNELAKLLLPNEFMINRRSKPSDVLCGLAAKPHPCRAELDKDHMFRLN